MPIPASTALRRSQVMTVSGFNIFCCKYGSGLAVILLKEISILAFAGGAFHYDRVVFSELNIF